MKPFLPILCALTACAAAHAHTPLPESRRSSAEIHVYRLGKDDLRRLFVENKPLDEKMLHTFVAGCAEVKDLPALPRGNYITVRAVGGRLQYNDLTVDNFRYHVVRDERIRLALSDTLGNRIENASAKHLRFDPRTKTYHTRRIGDKKTIEVDHDGVLHFISIDQRRPPRPLWQRFRGSVKRLFPGRGEKAYEGFVVFGKPRYKPGETVRFKAWMHRGGKPYDQEVDITLVGHGREPVKQVLTTLKPYRPGMYAWEFALDDSLKLTLDRTYTILLDTGNEDAKHLSGGFRYEDYELNRITFTARANREKYMHGDSVRITARALDENGMPVYDGKVEVNVRTGWRYDRVYLSESAFIPERIWEHTFDMEGMSEQEFTLPDSLFLKDVSMAYRIECVFTDAANERQTKSFTLHYDPRERRIDFSVDRGMLTIRELAAGQSVETPATLTAYTSDKKVALRKQVDLPCTMPLAWHAARYEIETGTASGNFHPRDAADEMIGHRFFREGDDVRLVVDNPAGIPFWYAVKKNNRVIDKGYADRLDYRRKDRGKNGWSMQLVYIAGDQVHNVSKGLSYFRQNITMEVSAPTTVWPGQTARIGVSVADRKGRPVRNADVTAYAYTSKFNAGPPAVKVDGKSVPARGFDNLYYRPKEQRLDHATAAMDWNVWRVRMGLDSIEYYRFLYPETLYTHSEPATSIRISPYAVLDGELQGVHLLWIDDQLRYVHQAEQLQTYAFAVRPGYHTVRMRTHDREITIENLYAADGKRHIFSVDCGGSATLGAGEERKPLIVKVTKDRKPELTPQEVDLLKRHMISIERVFGAPPDGLPPPPLILSTTAGYEYLNPTASRSTNPILVGPFPRGGIATLYAGGSVIRKFNFEGGYNYSLWEKHTKQSAWNPGPITAAIPKFTPNADFRVRTLTPSSIRVQYLSGLMRSLSTRSGRLMGAIAPSDQSCRLELDVRSKKDKPVMIHVVAGRENPISTTFYGGSSNLHGLPEGPVEVNLIFENLTRHTARTHLYRDGHNYLRIDTLHRRPTDSLTRAVFVEMEKFATPIPAADPLHEYDIPPRTTRKIPVSGSFSRNNYYRGVITGMVRYPDGKPAPGASLSIDGIKTRVATDSLGRFSLTYPGPRKLTFELGNYHSARVGIVAGYHYDIVLDESAVDRAELEAQDKVYNLSVQEQLVGYAAGVSVRGRSTVAEARFEPLIVVDGVPTEGNLAEMVDLYDVESIEVLKDTESTAVYGSRAAAGVVVIRTRRTSAAARDPEDDLMRSAGAGQAIRADFSDDAFWRPALKTDDKGRVGFEVTYPDDITRWTAHFIAVGGRRQTDKTQLDVKSFKPLNAQLSVPRFMVAGDSLQVVGRLTNHAETPLDAIRTIEVEGVSERDTLHIELSHVDRIPVVAHVGDSIRMEYALETAAGYFDGERRFIPVLGRGALETHGDFAVLNDTATRVFATDPARGEVTVHVRSSAIEVLLDEIGQIERYPYLCNEQMASKIKALVAKKRIYGWMGVDFDGDPAIKNLISGLSKNRNDEKLWGWWNRGATELWISRQVVEAMLEAGREGFETDFDRQGVIEALYGALIRGMSRSKADALDILLLLKRLDADVDYARYHADIASSSDATLHRKLRMCEAAWLLDLDGKPDAETVLKMSEKTLLGSTYWPDPREKNADRCWFPNAGSTDNTLIAYRVLKMAGAGDDVLSGIRNYFFEQRRSGSWRNIYEASRILETILPDMSGEGNPLVNNVVAINREKFETFPVTRTFAAGTEVRAAKTGGFPVFLTVYQRSWNAQPEKRNEGFEVETRFERDGAHVAELKAGEVVALKVSVNAASDAEYVMIEVPVPAGCSYVSKEAGHFRMETHREYFKDKAVIFCTRLAKGAHEFTIELNPRYPGRVHQNPARVELMYFPTAFGRNEVKSCHIGM